jgi:hypothetical protein
MSRRLLLLVNLVVATGVLVAAGSASAATAVSSNWAGYAVSPNSTKTTFKTVSASWVIPAGTCIAGQNGYSATWLGLGGYSETSKALEQIGTEFDCTSGKAKYSAWYELVPAGSKDIRMTVKPGDTIDAYVTVKAKRVTVLLRNRTHRSTFKKTITMKSPSPDVSTAEWIEEAPSACNSAGQCAQLPISNFGTVGFLRASATTAKNFKGTIGDAHWSPTTIQLSPGGRPRRFASASSSGGATPSSLSSDGSSFSVSYTESAPPASQTPTQFPGAGAPTP